MLRRIAPLFLALVGSCSSSTSPIAASVFTFAYSGAITGSYSATGNLPASQSAQETTQWSVAAVDASSMYVLSAAPRTASSHDYVSLDMSRTTAGTATISASCASNCGDMTVTFGQANGSGSTVLQTCFLETGTITITEITATRVKGTFSGTGTCFGPTGSSAAFTVTNGTFDVQIVGPV